jgi:hypothetical protein
MAVSTHLIKQNRARDVGMFVEAIANELLHNLANQKQWVFAYCEGYLSLVHDPRVN